MTHPHVDAVNAVWKRIGDGDYASAVATLTPDVKAMTTRTNGPWRSTGSRDEFGVVLTDLIQRFGGSLHLNGTCIYADDEIAVVRVRATGTVPGTGDEYDVREVVVGRFSAPGVFDHLWLLDIDSEVAHAFWERNPT
jgi:ketosteroid isomerase-like protein